VERKSVCKTRKASITPCYSTIYGVENRRPAGGTIGVVSVQISGRSNRAQAAGDAAVDGGGFT
jgi:hypothetical protein